MIRESNRNVKYLLILRNLQELWRETEYKCVWPRALSQTQSLRHMTEDYFLAKMCWFYQWWYIHVQQNGIFGKECAMFLLIYLCVIV